MLSVVKCELPGTGTSLSILLGVAFCLAVGLLVAGIARRSVHRLSAVAVVPVMLFALAAAPQVNGQDDCPPDTTTEEVVEEETTTTEAPTTTVAPTTTTVAPTTTVPPTTTTLPRISLSVKGTFGPVTITSISVNGGIPTTVTSTEWTGTIDGSNTSFSVTGNFNTVDAATGATCGAPSGSPSIVTCTINAGATSVTVDLASLA